MAKRGRPSTNKSIINRINISFTERELVLFEKLQSLAIDNDKPISEIARNILKIGLECYALGYNLGFDGKLVKIETNIVNVVPAKTEQSSQPINNKKESIFLS